MTDPTSSTPEPQPIPAPEPSPIPTLDAPTAMPSVTPTPPAASPYASTPYAPTAGPQAKTNTLAIIALILGIVFPLGGIITGHIALSQIKKTGEQGRGLALAGTILGYVLTIGTLLYLAGVIAVALYIGAHGGFDNPSVYDYNP